uniref:Uncharacterized protein n=1 Tax=viral metagenome TaxID=1070528 RepID=A0A6M3KG72_9ZZZZ
MKQKDNYMVLGKKRKTKKNTKYSVVQFRNRKGSWVTANLVKILNGRTVLLLVNDGLVYRKFSNIRFGISIRVRQKTDRDKTSSYDKKFKTRKRRFKLKKKTSVKRYHKYDKSTGSNKYNASSQ